jgi:hypothetical protein
MMMHSHTEHIYDPLFLCEQSLYAEKVLQLVKMHSHNSHTIYDPLFLCEQSLYAVFHE